MSATMAVTGMTAVMYTSDMPTKPDVPKEIAVFEARNRLGPIIEKARYFDGVTFFTNRGQRAAAVVPPELGELVDEVGGPAALIALVRAHLGKS